MTDCGRSPIITHIHPKQPNTVWCFTPEEVAEILKYKGYYSKIKMGHRDWVMFRLFALVHGVYPSDRLVLNGLNREYLGNLKFCFETLSLILKNLNITQLDMQDSGLSELNIRTLMKGLSKNNHVIAINFYDNKINDTTAKFILNNAPKKLKYLNLAKNKIKNQDQISKLANNKNIILNIKDHYLYGTNYQLQNS